MFNLNLFADRSAATTAHPRWTSLDVTANRSTGPANWQEPLPLYLVLLAREHAGKSALLTAMDLTWMGDYLPSGLQMNVMGDNGEEISPLVLNKRIEKTYSRLQHLAHGGNGLPTTLEAAPVNYVVCEGEEPRLQLHTSEEIGQLVSRRSVDSAPDDLARYHDLMSRLSQADVIAIMLNPPGKNPNTWAELQWRKDLTQYVSFLNEALRRHDGPVSVVLILNKIDSIFDDETTARAALTDAVLIEALRPLVQALEMSEKVQHAAVIPTSVFGFGQSVACEDDITADDSSADPALSHSAWLPDARQHEQEYVGRADGTLQPYNLCTLAVWSLLAGSLSKQFEVVGDEEPAVARTCRSLSQDLTALNGWAVSLKGDLLR
ncbi:MAG: hypothetical protein O3A00_27360 [Planctomycetota bacterium]|nr:hypothetical protein [Planctomycetota bacterium]